MEPGAVAAVLIAAVLPLWGLLISVSNHLFYDDRLVVFPSPTRERTSLGVDKEPRTAHLRVHRVPLSFQFAPDLLFEIGIGRALGRRRGFGIPVLRVLEKRLQGRHAR